MVFFDGRGFIVYIDVGIVFNIKLFYVKKCVFYKGFLSVIMVYVINKFLIEDNVIIDIVWFGK